MLEQLGASTLRHMHPAAAKCVFWELEPAVAEAVAAKGDPRFEKEAWLSAVLFEHPVCGFQILREGRECAIATIMFCQPRFAPGVAQLPTAPVSADAWLLTSLHIDPVFRDVGVEPVLIDAVLAHLWQHGAHAVEAFGLRDGIEHPGGMVPVPILQAAGFEEVAFDQHTPRLRIDLPPEHMLSAQAAEAMLQSALA